MNRKTSILSYALRWTTCEINRVCRCIDDVKGTWMYTYILPAQKIKKYIYTYMHTPKHTNHVDGIGGWDAFFFYKNSNLYGKCLAIFSPILYKSDQFDTTHITIITKKEDKSRLVGVLLSIKGRIAIHIWMNIDTSILNREIPRRNRNG